ncbi:epididymal secretory protein 4-like [Pogona vitticeps]
MKGQRWNERSPEGGRIAHAKHGLNPNSPKAFDHGAARVHGEPPPARCGMRIKNRRWPREFSENQAGDLPANVLGLFRKRGWTGEDKCRSGKEWGCAESGRTHRERSLSSAFEKDSRAGQRVSEIMKTALWILLLSGVCSLLAVDIPVDPTFDVTKVAGKWYPLITANYWRPYEKKPFHAFTATPLSNGGLELKEEIPGGGGCEVKSFVLQPQKPGVLRSEDGKFTLQVLKTDNNHNMVTRSERGDLVLLQLFAKGKKMQDGWYDHFFKLREELEFSPEKYHRLLESDLCTTPPK